jgi:hypothetical protein
LLHTDRQLVKLINRATPAPLERIEIHAIHHDEKNNTFHPLRIRALSHKSRLHDADNPDQVGRRLPRQKRRPPTSSHPAKQAHDFKQKTCRCAW